MMENTQYTCPNFGIPFFRGIPLEKWNLLGGSETIQYHHTTHHIHYASSFIFYSFNLKFSPYRPHISMNFIFQCQQNGRMLYRINDALVQFFLPSQCISCVIRFSTSVPSLLARRPRKLFKTTRRSRWMAGSFHISMKRSSNGRCFK